MRGGCGGGPVAGLSAVALLRWKLSGFARAFFFSGEVMGLQEAIACMGFV